jgi:hypothetical protein
MFDDKVKYIKANVSIKFNGEANVKFSVAGKNFELDLPDFDTDFHDFDFSHTDGDGDHYEGLIDREKITDLYEWDFFPPELVNFTKKIV